MASARSSPYPEQEHSCWFCSSRTNKKDHFWCSGGCGYELCRTCFDDGGPAITLKRVGGKWHCDECATKYWAGKCIYCFKPGLTLKPCGVCLRQACRKDSFWCQSCPYYICRHCQVEGVVPVRQIRGRWTCAWCHEHS